MSAPPAPAKDKPSFDPRNLMELYLRRQYDELSEKLLSVLTHFHDTTYFSIDIQTRYFINAFVKSFLTLFTQPDYILSERFVLPFIQLNVTIANLVAISDFKTTDPYLEMLRRQEANFVKILSLFNARCTAKFDRREFFDAQPEKASHWYNSYAEIYASGLLDEQVCKNLDEHFDYQDPRYDSTYQAHEVYFGSTYLDGTSDRKVKPALNRSFQRVAATMNPRVRNRPDPRKFVLLSSCWYPSHSVYRPSFGYLKELQGFHKTFIQLGNYGPQMDTSIFDDVKVLSIVNGVLNIDPLLDNDFMIAYFPDIGMSKESIMLANLRFAPIQICMLGHPVSTFGAEIDYWISGAVTEPPNPERNYSERLVLLPGTGAVHNRPLYEPTGRRKTVPEIVINCPWSPMKMNARFTGGTLRELVKQSPRPLRFRVFSGAALTRHNDYLPFARRLAEQLAGAQVEVLAGLPYPQYMAMMEEGDITIDSYHFGGSNVVSDSLFLRKPTVTWEGDHWYSRIGTRMLHAVGIGELAATTEKEYLDNALRLIRDDAYRAQIGERLRKADLDNTIFSMAEARYMNKALHYLVDNHERLRADPDRSAIRIEP